MNSRWATRAGSAIALAAMGTFVSAEGPVETAEGPVETAAAAAPEIILPREPSVSADSRLIFLGADPQEGLPGPVGEGLSVLALSELPPPDGAEVQVLAALLRSNPVSAFVSTPEETHAQTDALHLVSDIELVSAGEGTGISLGGETLEMSAFGERLAGLIAAFAPRERQIGFFRIADPDGRFPAALPQVRAALDRSGFAMSVLMIGAAACEAAERPALHYAVLSGVPDRAPFGDGDGQATAAEVVDWISAALERDVARGSDCAADYSLILRGDEDDARILARAGDAVIPDMDSEVYMETFEALFLMSSADPEPIRAYLQACTYCPSEDSLGARLRDIGARALALRLETGVWETIRGDTTPARFTVYLENCTLCAFRDEAEARIAAFDAAEEARAAEEQSFARLASARDLAGLRGWLEDCTACAQEEEAKALIAELEADGRYQAEQEALDAAVEALDEAALRDWLEECEVCDDRARAEAALTRVAAREAATAPCIAAAGLPQAGGPRLLAEIDTRLARTACEAALAEFPQNEEAALILGRVAQAEGDADAAAAAYRDGMAAGLPAAYGLAAHSAYSPTEGVADYAEAERLAKEGLEHGDWLSGEVLTVLYSRQLVEGRGPEDAFATALEQARAGNPVAQFFVGYFYRTGTGTDASARQAERWLDASVEQGYVHANTFLAEIYEEGPDGIEPDPERAADLLWDALEAGDPTALERLTDDLDDRPRDVVQVLQTRLQEAGVFNGRIDGLPGPATVRAVEAYVEETTTG